jgi:hypothetical protein
MAALLNLPHFPVVLHVRSLDFVQNVEAKRVVADIGL